MLQSSTSFIAISHLINLVSIQPLTIAGSLKMLPADYMETLFSYWAIFSDRAVVRDHNREQPSATFSDYRRSKHVSVIEIYPTLHLLAYFVYVLLVVKTMSFVTLLLNSSILHSMPQRPNTETLMQEIRKYECLYDRYSKEHKDKCKKMNV